MVYSWPFVLFNDGGCLQVFLDDSVVRKYKCPRMSHKCFIYGLFVGIRVIQ